MPPETTATDPSQRYDMLQAGLDLLDQGITVFDGDLRLVAWNRTFLDLLEFPDQLAYVGAPFEGFIRFNAERGAENSLWHALQLQRGPLLELLSSGPLLAASLFALWAAARAARRDGAGGRAVRLGAALALTAWIAITGMYSSSGRSSLAHRAPLWKDTPSTSSQGTSLSPSRFRTDTPAGPMRRRGLANNRMTPAMTRPSIAMAT